MIRFSIHKTLQSAHGTMELNVACEINTGEFITIYGASGAGKTTILKILAGLLHADNGFIEVNGQTWYDGDKINIKPQKRKIGFVFQDYALFPNMTVKENLDFALDKRQSDDMVEELLGIMELDKLQNRKPQTLSGGQQQRVALARALVRKPEILLLDEPLSALDNEMRTKLQDVIVDVHSHYKLTTILVSHDISEIFRMSNKILFLEHGTIKMYGTPSDVFFGGLISGKFQFIGEILEIVKEDIIYVVKILVGNYAVKVVAEENEIRDFKKGDKVIVASKAFNPLIRKYTGII